MANDDAQTPIWAGDIGQALARVEASAGGLSSAQARARLKRFGPNRDINGENDGLLKSLAAQLASPMMLILLGAALLSFGVDSPTDGWLILGIVAIGSLLGLWQHQRAGKAVARLQRLVAPQARVLRDGVVRKLPVAALVPGDVIQLVPGASVPADCRLLSLKDLHVNEAMLTGESFPVEKQLGDLPAQTEPAARANSVFQGSHVVSGSAHAVVMRTGAHTGFGEIAARLRLRPEQGAFERGLRDFGGLLLQLTGTLVILIFAINVLMHRPVLEAFLFALALAVGLMPELLPAIVSVNLAIGAQRMARRAVIVKRLASIEDFGGMTVLCADKTGTLTDGALSLAAAVDARGMPCPRAITLAGINAAAQDTITNPLDRAIVAAAGPSSAACLDLIPYDFQRKRVSVLARLEDDAWLIVKGAVNEVLALCEHAQMAEGIVPIAEQRAAILAQQQAFGDAGQRTLALAARRMPGRDRIGQADETALCFIGLLAFEDPPREGIGEVLARLGTLGVSLKIITGDSRAVTRSLARQVGLAEAQLLTGEALRGIGDDALPGVARATQLFAEIEPNQKERIVRALRKSGEVVGFLGDGINDAPALHAADVGVSVHDAADVAREAADIVLLQGDLRVLAEGVVEGRITFANTLKYVHMATSANFGNMLSMALVSVVLPFLPMLPKQILLTNLLTDLPEMAIATDRVDPASIASPPRWDMREIRGFMLRFGLLSSVFDLLCFAVLAALLQASPSQLRSGWFVESVCSAALVVLVIRSREPFWRSRPSLPLVLATLLVVCLTLALPFSPLAPLLGFEPLSLPFLTALALILAAYLGSAELLKWHWWRWHRRHATRRSASTRQPRPGMP